jgi:RTX calcium-binding nonapeptide repeat (4 copies)
MTRRTHVAALATALTLLAPAAAQAVTTISWSSSRLAATNDGAGTSVSLYTRELTFSDGSSAIFPAFAVGGEASYPTDHCIVDFGYIVCDPADSFLLQGGSGADRLLISDEPELNVVPATLSGGGGPDRLQDQNPAGRTLDGGDGTDTLEGGSGDEILRGGPGNDEIDGAGGRDNVSGGDGDDTLFGDHFEAPASDVIDGGPGFDRIDDWSVTSSGPSGVSVTLDNVANDGRPGENDNVIGVESIEGPQGTYVGSDAAETFVVGASGETSSVSGGGGNDTITTLNGSDGVDGGPGDDRIVAGLDNDTITGGPGRDTIFADSTGSYCGIYSCTVPFGNDTVNARDGEPDQIDCGIGADRAVVDTIDTAANCEAVDAAAPPGGPAGGGPGARGAASLAGVTKRSIRRIAARGLKIRVKCVSACTIRASLVTNRRLARTLRLPRSRILAAGRKTLRRAGTATLTLKVARKAKRRFKRLRTATVTLKVAVRGADKKTTRISRRLRLKR